MIQPKRIVTCFVVFFVIIFDTYGQKTKESDPFTYQSLYKGSSDFDSVTLLYKEKQSQLSSFEHRFLNTVAYSNAIDLLGYHSEAIELLEKLQKKDEFSQLSTVAVAEYYGILGNISLQNENPELAVSRYEKSISLINSEFSPETKQVLYMRASKGFNAVGAHDSAMIYLNKAMDLETNGTNRNSLYLRLNIALTNSFLGNLEEAKAYFKNAQPIIDLENDHFAKIRSLGNIGDIYAQQDSFELSEIYYTEGMELAQKMGMTLDLIRFNQSLSNLYAANENFMKAYTYNTIADSISQQYNSSKYSEEIVALELNHKIKEEKWLNELKSQSLEEEKKTRLILILFISVLATLLVGLTILLFKLNRKNKVLLEKSLAASSKMEKEQSSNSNRDQYHDLIDQLEKALQDNTIIFDTKLNIDGLAKRLQTNRTYLSDAINSHYAIGFSRLINNRRIDEAQKMLLSEEFDHFSIEGIASTVGFSSISAFNSNFKRVTGLTPSYLRKNRK